MTRTRRAARLREAVVPDWLAEVVRLRRAPVPRADMIRAGCAICVPLAVAIAAGQRAIGLLVAMGGLMGTVVDKGAPYMARVRRVAGWHLALERLLGTLLGCAIVLLVGYAPWPTSWQVHLPGQFARTVRDVCRYMQAALVTAPAGQPERAGPPPQIRAPGRRAAKARDRDRGFRPYRPRQRESARAARSLRRIGDERHGGRLQARHLIADDVAHEHRAPCGSPNR